MRCSVVSCGSEGERSGSGGERGGTPARRASAGALVRRAIHEESAHESAKWRRVAAGTVLASQRVARPVGTFYCARQHVTRDDEPAAREGGSRGATHRGNVVSAVNVLGSVALAALLLVVHFAFESELALAQAADSMSDVLTGLLLAWAARAANAPADDEHPLGHARAEPIAALVVAVLAGVLASEVARSAIVALALGEHATLGWPVAAVFATKVVFKLGIARVSRSLVRKRASPVLDALRIDARNDAVVGSVALVGFGLARAGLPAIDPVLAVGVAVYVGASSVHLALSSVDMLLGTSASPERRRALTELVHAAPRVAGVAKLLAISHGASLHVEVDVLVDADLTLGEAHDVAHGIEERLRREPDVAHVVVHVTPSTKLSA